VIELTQQEPTGRWQKRDLWLGLGMLLAGYAGIIAAILFLGSDGDPREDPNVALVSSVASLGFTIWLGAAVLILATRRDISLAGLGFREAKSPVKWIAIGVVGSYSIMVVYSLIVLGIEEATGNDLSRFTEGNVPDDLAFDSAVWVVLGLSVLVAAPICEELFFRGFLFRAVEQHWGVMAGIVVSGFIFGSIHLEPSVIAPFWAVGMLLAWVYHRSGSLWTTIAAHAIFNGIGFIALLATTRAG